MRPLCPYFDLVWHGLSSYKWSVHKMEGSHDVMQPFALPGKDMTFTWTTLNFRLLFVAKITIWRIFAPTNSRRKRNTWKVAYFCVAGRCENTKKSPFGGFSCGTVWSPVTDHYVNKVIFFSVNSKCQDCFYVADKGIIYSND